jgi:hypothetical protein
MRNSKVVCTLSGLLMGLGIGCGSSVEEPAAPERACFVGTPGCVPTSNGSMVGRPADGSAPAGRSGASSSGSMVADSVANGGGNGGAAADVPCAVAQVLSDKCIQCHSAQPRFGASMPLTTMADLHAPAKSDPKRKVYELIPERINAQDVSRRMPPASSPELAIDDLRALNAWTSGGAVADGPLCAIRDGSTTPTVADPGGGGTTADGTSTSPIEYNDPEMKCYRFMAHEAGDKQQPHAVATTPDMYKGFTFAAPWTGTVYARSFKAIIDNDQLIHHWLFFKNSTAGNDGEVIDSSGAHPDGNLVHGWAPGGSDLYLDADVGEALPADVSYTLETHYNNTTGAVAPDASGIEVCVTPKVPKNIASISWLGTDVILGTTAEGECAPLSTEPIQIIGGTPHMHVKGQHMKVTINRADGTKDVFLDKPFDFNYQLSYPMQTTIMPGDTLTTTCTYSEPATYGKSTTEEMCYLFTLYYPTLALTNLNPVGIALHGPDTCLPIL